MKNKHAAALGKRGGKAGKGSAKARTSEQARAAANSRWEKERANENMAKDANANRNAYDWGSYA